MSFVKDFRKLLRRPSSLAIFIGLILTVILLSVIGFVKVAYAPGTGGQAIDASGMEPNGRTEIPNKVNTSQLPDSSFIYDVSIEDVAKADSYMDGQTVQVTGEVVGDRIIAENDPNYCWITLQSNGDKSDAELATYMSSSSSSSIDTFGAYGKRGTYLQVRGTFNLACRDHQGVSDVHAENVAVVSQGMNEKQEFDPYKLSPGLAILMAGFIALLSFNYMREKQR